MTPDQRFEALMVVLAAVLTGIGWLSKSLLSVSRQWGRTGAKLEELSNDIRGLVESKEREHNRMDTRMDRIEGRVERHEDWHSNRAP